MDATEARELITYDTAMWLTGMPQRTFYRRIKQNLVPVYFDSTDRGKRWISRADLPLLVQPVERSSETSAA